MSDNFETLLQKLRGKVWLKPDDTVEVLRLLESTFKLPLGTSFVKIVGEDFEIIGTRFMSNDGVAMFVAPNWVGPGPLKKYIESDAYKVIPMDETMFPDRAQTYLYNKLLVAISDIEEALESDSFAESKIRSIVKDVRGTFEYHYSKERADRIRALTEAASRLANPFS